MYENGDTQPIDVDSITRELEKLTVEEQLEKAVEIASRRAGLETKLPAVDASGSESVYIPPVAELLELLRSNWSLFEELLNVSAHRDLNPQRLRADYERMTDLLRQQGLSIKHVESTTLPDQQSLREANNFMQLVIEGDAWVLWIGETDLELRLKAGSPILAEEVAHEFLAWKLMSKDEDVPDLQHKKTKNQLLPSQHGGILQTHFFDLVFDALIQVRSRMDPS